MQLGTVIFILGIYFDSVIPNRTDKKKVYVPCGHGQYCSTCIEGFAECALCRKTVTSVVKLFNI